MAQSGMDSPYDDVVYDAYSQVPTSFEPNPLITAEKIALTSRLLALEGHDSPFARWIEYQAYHQLVALLQKHLAFPDGFEVLRPDDAVVLDWIRGRGPIPQSYIEEIQRIMRELEARGDASFHRICGIYCRLKKKIGVAGDAATLVLSISQVAELLLAIGADFLFLGGVPVTAFLTLMVHSGALDDICKCK
jgi:hypothetical protein